MDDHLRSDGGRNHHGLACGAIVSWLHEFRVTATMLATLGLIGFLHYQAAGSTADMWMSDGVILAGVSAMLVGRAFGTGDIAKIVAARNGK